MTVQPSIRFSNTTPNGKLNLSIDMTDVLPTGVTVSSATVSIAVHEDSDAADALVATRLTSTTPTINGTGKIMTARFELGLVNVDYVLTFIPTLSDTEVEPVTAVIAVRKYT